MLLNLGFAACVAHHHHHVASGGTAAALLAPAQERARASCRETRSECTRIAGRL
jgi:hypothetical protein